MNMTAFLQFQLLPCLILHLHGDVVRCLQPPANSEAQFPAHFPDLLHHPSFQRKQRFIRNGIAQHAPHVVPALKSLGTALSDTVTDTHNAVKDRRPFREFICRRLGAE